MPVCRVCSCATLHMPGIGKQALSHSPYLPPQGATAHSTAADNAHVSQTAALFVGLSRQTLPSAHRMASVPWDLSAHSSSCTAGVAIFSSSCSLCTARFPRYQLLTIMLYISPRPKHTRPSYPSLPEASHKHPAGSYQHAAAQHRKAESIKCLNLAAPTNKQRTGIVRLAASQIAVSYNWCYDTTACRNNLPAAEFGTDCSKQAKRT